MNSVALSFKLGVCVVALIGGTSLSGQENATGFTELAGRADVVFLGEQHDNPHHHHIQAQWVERLSATALVFEMLTPEQAALVTDENRYNAVTLESVLDWNHSGWPDFEMYFPIFAAAPTARIYGAGVPRDRLRSLMQEDLPAVAGLHVAQKFALDVPLDPAEQKAREALQHAAHCDALPQEMLPMMVDVQRLRDTALAAAALEALENHGPPVAVITGNGHARTDWGAPFLLQRAAPEVSVFSLGLSEDSQTPAGEFTAITNTAAVPRGDPCAAFQQ
ncbi:MAG: ChaN family lipoprotein [Roseobacter sp.]